MNAPSSPLQGADVVDDELDAPSPDINAIGAPEKPFPLWIFLVGGSILLAILLAFTYLVKNAKPFLTPSKKEDIPTIAESDPTLNTPKLNPAKTGEPIEQFLGIEKISPASQGAARAAGAPLVPGTQPSASTNAGNGPCPTTALLDANQRPVLGAGGAPIAIDCKGAQVVMHTPAPASTAKETTTAVRESADRYRGEILLSKQISTEKTASSVSGFPGGLPQLPAPPVGAADVLRQLEALQRGQASPLATLASNPILATQPAGRAGTLNAQGNPGTMLASDKTERTFAARTLDENTIIPKGTPIDCSLTTRLVTDISGFAACQITRNVYSANGRVLLIERMSMLDGEYVAATQGGQRYIHVLWTRLRKPHGITIDIASPSTDGLGGAGIPATVDNRWLERLGGAYLLSFVKDAITYATARDAQGGSSTAGAVLLQNTVKESESMAEKVLNSTINIKPVLYANQGDRVGIYVARDLDFSKVYEVRAR